jgi:hypothetical protein
MEVALRKRRIDHCTPSCDGPVLQVKQGDQRRLIGYICGISATQCRYCLLITAGAIDLRKAIRLKYRRSQRSACIDFEPQPNATMAGAFLWGALSIPAVPFDCK